MLPVLVFWQCMEWNSIYLRGNLVTCGDQPLYFSNLSAMWVCCWELTAEYFSATVKNILKGFSHVSKARLIQALTIAESTHDGAVVCLDVVELLAVITSDLTPAHTGTQRHVVTMVPIVTTLRWNRRCWKTLFRQVYYKKILFRNTMTGVVM